jgi:hypothetical protein
LARVRTATGFGFIDTTGAFRIVPVYGSAYGFNQELAPVKIDSGWGFITHYNKLAIDAKFQDVNAFTEGKAAVRMGKWGYIDPSGKTIIQPQYDYADVFSDGLAAVQWGRKWGYVNDKGELKIDTMFSDAFNFKDGLAPVKAAKWGYIDDKGKFAIEPQYDRAGVFAEGRAVVQQDGKTFFIGKDGKPLPHEIAMQDALGFSNGLAPVQVNGQWGFMDGAGKLAIAAQYDRAGNFSAGRAPVKVGGKWGYINRSGAVVIKPQFDEAYGFSKP